MNEDVDFFAGAAALSNTASTAGQSLRVVAHLDSPLCGNHPPHLDSVLVNALAMAAGGAERRSVVQNSPEPPAMDDVAIPIDRSWAGQWLIARCSSPILGAVAQETVERLEKHIDAHLALLLRPDERKVITATDKGYMKRRWLPRRVRAVECVAWLCVGRATELEHVLRTLVLAVGQDVSRGYGRVRCWKVEQFSGDYSWFAPTEYGQVLMRPLPLDHAEYRLPAGLLGQQRDYGSVCPPYYHPRRRTEIVVPA